MSDSKTTPDTEKCVLPDLQNQADVREIGIDRVGITNVMFPIKVLQKDGELKEVSARTKVFVGLPAKYKGVNMSRFAVTLAEYGHKVISSDSMPALLELLAERLVSDDAYARFEFDYYLDRAAPVSKLVAPMAYRCAFTGVKKGDDVKFIIEANVIAASLCPCSKGMSALNLLGRKELGDEAAKEIEETIGLQKLGELIGDKVGMGAHNQRSNIRAEVICKPGQKIWLEDLIDLIEAEGSAPTYPILKRPDEKFVTEQAYNNAKFSEDILRDVQIAIENQDVIDSWTIRVYNEESIHPYDVTAYQKSDNWEF